MSTAPTSVGLAILSAIVAWSGSVKAQDMRGHSPSQLEALSTEQLRILADYDGTWEGTLNIQALRGVADAKWQKFELKIRIVIAGDQSSVSLFENAQWNEMSQYRFQMVRNRTNAVVAAVVSREGAHWVETWNFSLTQLEKDLVFATYNRMVNNFIMNKDQDFSRAVFVGHGEMRRVGRSPPKRTPS
jgi:hypothetical protein